MSQTNVPNSSKLKQIIVYGEQKPEHTLRLEATSQQRNIDECTSNAPSYVVMFSIGLNLNSNDHYLMACSIFGMIPHFTAPNVAQIVCKCVLVCVCLFLCPISLTNCEYIMSTYDSKVSKKYSNEAPIYYSAKLCAILQFFFSFAASFSSMPCSIFLCSSRAENRMKKLIYAKFSLHVLFFFFFSFSFQRMHETNAFQSIQFFFLSEQY